MSLYLHPDVLENGLSELTSATLTMALCDSPPLSRSDAATLKGNGGLRVSEELAVNGVDVTLGPGDNADSRRVTIQSQTIEGAYNVSNPNLDCWLALYDGTRLLVVTSSVNLDGISDQSSIEVPELRISFNQPILE